MCKQTSAASRIGVLEISWHHSINVQKSVSDIAIYHLIPAGRVPILIRVRRTRAMRHSSKHETIWMRCVWPTENTTGQSRSRGLKQKWY